MPELNTDLVPTNATVFDTALVSPQHNIGQPGVAQSVCELQKLVTAIADSTATTVLTLTLPNANLSAVMRILVRSAITNSSHTYDSTRVVEYFATISRLAGGLAVVVLSAAVGAQIASTSGAQTLTTALSAQAVSGAVTATETCNLQITNVNGSAGTTETQIFAELMNGAGVFAVGASIPTGVYMS